MVSYLKKTKFSLLVRSWQNVEMRQELLNGRREATLQKGLTSEKKKGWHMQTLKQGNKKLYFSALDKWMLYSLGVLQLIIDASLMKDIGKLEFVLELS